MPCPAGPRAQKLPDEEPLLGTHGPWGRDPFSRAQVTRCVRQELLCLGTVSRHILPPQACVQLGAENLLGKGSAWL